MSIFKRNNKGKKDKVDDKSSFVSQYKKVKSDIETLDNKYTDYVLKSLNMDMESYASNMHSNYGYWDKADSTFDKSRWHVSSMSDSYSYSSARFQLRKINEKSKVEINIEYKISSNEEIFTLEGIDCNIYVDTERSSALRKNLNKEILKDLITEYYACIKLNGLRKQHEKKINDFKIFSDVVGKDVKRDSVIDSILS